MNEYIVDHIEEDIAICEALDGSFVKIAVKNLPTEVREGDVLNELDGVYIINYEETQSRKEYADSLLKDLCD
ncbi:MAG: DUF3006 domain-containing protein [Oscillospiraceae bacterium]